MRHLFKEEHLRTVCVFFFFFCGGQRIERIDPDEKFISEMVLQAFEEFHRVAAATR